MNLGLIKSGIQLISGFGVGLIIDEGIKKIRPRHLTGIKNMAVKAGGVVLSMMVADKATDYVGEIWDKTAEDLKEIVKPQEEVTEETVEETVEG